MNAINLCESAPLDFTDKVTDLLFKTSSGIEKYLVTKDEKYRDNSKLLECVMKDLTNQNILEKLSNADGFDGKMKVFESSKNSAEIKCQIALYSQTPIGMFVIIAILLVLVISCCCCLKKFCC